MVHFSCCYIYVFFFSLSLSLLFILPACWMLLDVRRKGKGEGGEWGSGWRWWLAIDIFNKQTLVSLAWPCVNGIGRRRGWASPSAFPILPALIGRRSRTIGESSRSLADRVEAIRSPPIWILKRNGEREREREKWKWREPCIDFSSYSPTLMNNNQSIDRINIYIELTYMLFDFFSLCVCVCVWVSV